MGKPKFEPDCPKCSKCDRKLGVVEKVLPFGLDGTMYCPKCFVHNIAPTQGNRFSAEYMYATKCGRCGMEAVSPGGRGGCSYCGSAKSIKHI